MSTSHRDRIAEQLQDFDYRTAFVEQSVRRFLPAQIRAMREERDWSQEELGRRCGKTQEWICKLESQTYGRYSTQTLIDLARGFDVGLIIKLASFGSFLDSYAVPPSLAGIPSFENDPRARPSAAEAPDHGPKLRLVAGATVIRPGDDLHAFNQRQVVDASAA